MARPRVLMLHGMLRNAHVLERKMRHILAAVGPEAEFVWVDSVRTTLLYSRLQRLTVCLSLTESLPDEWQPHVMRHPTVRRSLFPVAADYRSGVTLPSDAPPPPEGDPRCWWYASDHDTQTGHFEGVTESLVLLRRVLIEQGPFDGVVGFSMGASIATLLLALIENPSRHPVFAEPGPSWPPRQFKFAIMVSGFLCRDQNELVREALRHGVRTPALLIFGATDTIVPDCEQPISSDTDHPVS